jgi:hypothetical protein
MTKQEPIAWAVIDSKGNVVELAKNRLALEHDHIRQDDQIKKLYLSEPIIFTKEEIEAIELSMVKRLDLDAIYVLRNLLQRIKDNNEQSQQMEIAREIMKQDRECLRNLSKNNDDPIKNFDS